MPVTHGVAGSSPVRTAKKVVRNGYLFLFVHFLYPQNSSSRTFEDFICFPNSINFNDTLTMKENKNITSKNGTPLTLLGNIMEVGDIAPNFNAVNINGERVKLSDFKGKTIIITVFPAINTPVCSMQTREFNKRAAALDKEIVVLGISKDDISDTKKFCIAEGIRNIHILSDKKYEDFGVRYGFEIKELGLLARGTIIIDKDGRIAYTEYVSDIVDEPAYDKAIKAVEILNHKYTFKLEALPYQNDALAPYISEETINFHYGKHLQTYIDNLNTLIENSSIKGKTINDIILNSDGALFNNAAQVFNHNFYFESLAPQGERVPGENLLKAIEKKWGSFENFQKEFSTAATQLFGSGWIWLVKENNGELSIFKSSNADTPIKYGLTPLLTFDVWEHAYYLDYQNRRAEHIAQLWHVINWNIVEERYKM